VAGGLRSNSLAAASAPPEAACEEALDGYADARCRAGGVVAAGRRAADAGAGWREAQGADDASSSPISALSARRVCSTT